MRFTGILGNRGHALLSVLWERADIQTESISPIGLERHAFGRPTLLRAAARTQQTAFTLIELLVVIAIIRLHSR